VGSEWNIGLLAGAALAVATTTGTALFLTHDRAGKRFVLGGDFPREILGVLHGSLLSGVKVHNAKNIFASMCKYMLYINRCQAQKFLNHLSFPKEPSSVATATPIPAVDDTITRRSPLDGAPFLVYAQ